MMAGSRMPHQVVSLRFDFVRDANLLLPRLVK